MASANRPQQSTGLARQGGCSQKASSLSDVFVQGLVQPCSSKLPWREQHAQWRGWWKVVVVDLPTRSAAAISMGQNALLPTSRELPVRGDLLNKDRHWRHYAAGWRSCSPTAICYGYWACKHATGPQTALPLLSQHLTSPHCSPECCARSPGLSPGHALSYPKL